MFEERVKQFIDYCKSREYYVKIDKTNENIYRIHIANKYLQQMEFKVINGSKVRILSHENSRFAQEILNTVNHLLIEVVPYHYDHIISPDIPSQTKLNRELKCQMELNEIANMLEKLNIHDEVKIYTNFKGLITIFRHSCKIHEKYHGTIYEQIYNMIKEKKLLVHFEWIRKTPPRIKPKKGNAAPVISKKLLVR